MNTSTLAFAACIVTFATTGSAQTKTAAKVPAQHGKTQIVFLGTGYPRPLPDRMGPSLAIIANGTAYLVDAGTGLVRRAAETKLPALEASKLRFVFVTHLHSDHTIGLPDIITTPWIMGRTQPLELYGPPGISAMARHIHEAYKEDKNIRVKGLEHANETGSDVNAYDIKPGFVYRDSNVKITTFAVKHGSWKNAYGYRFETPDRTIVVSGDASPSESVVENCNGCDVLIHEAYTQLGASKSTDAWKEYIASYHTSTKELADLATRAKPKMLILWHQMYFGGPTDTEAVMLKEIRASYKGRVASAHDLDVF
jgi:ribonuclease BN (tRNA processing enzyme)